MVFTDPELLDKRRNSFIAYSILFLLVGNVIGRMKRYYCHIPKISNVLDISFFGKKVVAA